MSARHASAAGFSLVEVSIVLMVVAILTAVAAPSASRTLDRARVVRAVGDAEAIKTAMINFGDDLNSYQGFNIDGSSSSGDQVEMAVSDGDTPIEVSFDGDERWICPVAVVPDPGCDVTDFLENHLILNNPYGGSNVDAYPLAGGNTWRGAYLNGPVDPDPWGNRYAVNVRYLQAPSETKNDVIVLSAGPDEQIDTQYEKDGIFPGDDDIIVVINRHKGTPVP
jgi:prepilin-type N-terminal cleavage/methylation domain-containing protein